MPGGAHQPFSNVDSAARGSSLLSIKTQQKAREEEEKQRQKRKKGIIVMVMQFLQQQGYARTLDALQSESNVSLHSYTPADNIDLNTIFTEYEEYYDFRFGRRPKFFRNFEPGDTPPIALSGAGEGEKVKHHKRSSSTESGTPPAAPLASGAKAPAARAKQFGSIPMSAPAGAGGVGFFPPVGKTGSPVTENQQQGDGDFVGVGVSGKAIKMRKDPVHEGVEDEVFQGRALKPIPHFETAELNELAATIHRDILDQNPSVRWNDIAELGHAKQLLKEAVVMPVKYPELFSGIMRPWKGILLFGPPGTGKTMLAKAVATECKTTFFNISASSIVSKWRGDSEKLVRMLFDLAVYYAPSTIFIDELDSLMSSRTNDGSEHEGSRRTKTELLVQMDGLAKRKHGDVVFVLAASNVPWDLDAAVLRRLEKRIHVGLPSLHARAQLFRHLLTSVESGFDFDLVGKKTEGHSGADIDIICREATMRTVRQLIEKLEAEKDLPQTALQKPKVTVDDVLESIRCTHSSCATVDLKKYIVWEAQFGSTISK